MGKSEPIMTQLTPDRGIPIVGSHVIAMPSKSRHAALNSKV
jgi:hypothetical protein